MALLAAIAIGVAIVIVTAGGGSSAPRVQAVTPRADGDNLHSPAKRAGGSRRHRQTAPFAVGETRLRLVDHARTVTLPDGSTVPRTLETIVRYPALGKPRRGDRPGATPARPAGPFPLIVFGHGFALTPAPYAALLRAWARAGYVVAAPLFPLGNAHAPGGPNESDLPNQPGDIRFVITRMLRASAKRSGRLRGLIDPHEIAVAGHSDGGDTALAVAYDRPYRDPRIDAAVILSGAEIPWIASFRIAPGGPPLLATQGTADPINLPSATAAFYDSARVPKYLLQLLGATHLGPYSTEQPQLRIVERVTIAFLDRYLKGVKAGLHRMIKAGNVPGIATLEAHPSADRRLNR